MYRVYQRAEELPGEWDDLTGDNFYLKKDFLEFIEETDPCGQRYYIFHHENGEADTILMTYSRSRFNLFMFTPLKASLSITFIYVPLSVTRPGYAGREELLPEVSRFLRSIKGYKLFLNTREDFSLPGFIQTTTFPRCVLALKWKSLDEYLKDLRSSYRRRYRLALKRSAPLSFRMLENNEEFDDRLYSLYEEVYEASPYRIEKLGKAFFQGPQTRIFVYSLDGLDVGFIQLIENGKELIFEFVGFDHALNRQYDIYISLLVRIVEYGINNGFTTIDFGQTADEAKLRLGTRYQALYALLHHSNPLVHGLTRLFINKIGYKPLDQDHFHVFHHKNNLQKSEVT
ncbi:MAG: GNAT family N-acetyltransferase [Spirochaetales bacterium]|nr:GNAT family N-acetyltransferase [Spirochaetales bacterium]